MARLVINTSTPNSGRGDSLFTAFSKINQNFNELYSVGFKGWVFKTSDYTAENGDRIIANTSSGPFTITLPADPQQGYFVEIADGWNFSINNLTLISAYPIEGYDEDVIINIHGLSLEFVFVENSWQILTTLGVKGDKGDPGDAADRLVNGTKEVILSANGTLTMAGSIVHTVNTPAYVATPVALDLTKTIHKLAAGVYTLADGVEGQVIHIVPRPNVNPENVSVAVQHGRVVTDTRSLDVEGIIYYPFKNSTEFRVHNVITMIFTDGAWQTDSGEWE
jgi:hypothetical protein